MNERKLRREDGLQAWASDARTRYRPDRLGRKMDPAARRGKREKGLIAGDRVVREDAVRGVVENVDVFVEIDCEDRVRGAVAHAHHKDDAEPLDRNHRITPD